MTVRYCQFCIFVYVARGGTDTRDKAHHMFILLTSFNERTQKYWRWCKFRHATVGLGP